MKKTSFVIAILASALLAAACHKKPANTTPTGGSGSDMGSGSAMGSDMGSGSAMGSAAGSGG